MLGFLDAGVSVAYHVVTALVHVLTPLAGGLAAPAAIVAFTIAIRLLLLPLSYYALRGQAAHARLQPELQELRRRHAGQPDRLQRELSALYQREGAGMLAGCLPMLAQLPLFSIMYRLFLSGSVGGQPNVLLTHTLLGAPLGAHWLGAHLLGAHLLGAHVLGAHVLGAAGLVSGQGLVFLVLFALLALVGWSSARLSRRGARLERQLAKAEHPLAKPGRPAARPARPAARPARPGQGAAQDWVISMLTRVVPYSTVVIAMFVPLAAGLYLLTTTSWTVAERTALLRRLQQAPAPSATRPGPAPV